ncbi:MAG TPA: helix-turn-helix domain-containing protein [Solirubrobacteraceae bacterium]|nr:helix-turn-helix domain-containing protein [Solirubrobacteraceae bacterium]
MNSAELLLHPVRLRIVQAFLGDRALTTAQLGRELQDVPTGSLYRHVALLTRSGVLQVVAERRVRGAVERTYTLRLAAAQVSPADLAAMSADQHRHAFMAFLAAILAELDRYLDSGRPNLARDRAGYRLAAAWLTDAELEEMLTELVAVIGPRLANPPGRGRRRRVLAGVLLPAPEPGTRRRGART